MILPQAMYTTARRRVPNGSRELGGLEIACGVGTTTAAKF